VWEMSTLPTPQGMAPFTLVAVVVVVVAVASAAVIDSVNVVYVLYSIHRGDDDSFSANEVVSFMVVVVVVAVAVAVAVVVVDNVNVVCMLYSIHPGDDDSFSADEVVSFIHALEEHYYHYFRIKLAVRLLVSLSVCLYLIIVAFCVKVWKT